MEKPPKAPKTKTSKKRHREGSEHKKSAKKAKLRHFNDMSTVSLAFQSANADFDDLVKVVGSETVVVQACTKFKNKLQALQEFVEARVPEKQPPASKSDKKENPKPDENSDMDNVGVSPVRGNSDHDELAELLVRLPGQVQQRSAAAADAKQSLLTNPTEVQPVVVHEPMPILAHTMVSPIDAVPPNASTSSSSAPANTPPVKSKKRRGKLPDSSTIVLKKWLFERWFHPYPTEEEKGVLCTQTNLTMNQINNWFTNARRRILPKNRQAPPSQPAQTANNQQQEEEAAT